MTESTLSAKQAQSAAMFLLLCVCCFGLLLYGMSDTDVLLGRGRGKFVFRILYEVGGTPLLFGTLGALGLLFLVLGIRSFLPQTHAAVGNKVTRLDRKMGNDVLHVAPSANLPMHIRFMLGVGAQLSAYNGSVLNAVQTGKPPEYLHGGLQTMWGIENREQFLGASARLSQLPNKASYEALWNAMRTYEQNPAKSSVAGGMFGGANLATKQVTFQLTSSLAPVFEKDFNVDPQGFTEWQMQTASAIESCDEWIGQMRTSGVDVDRVSNMMIWDAGRLVNVSRWCFELGFISDAELLQICVPLAQMVQRSYDGSWKEMADAYIVASILWSEQQEGDAFGDDAKDRLNAFVRTYKMLGTDPSSPFVQVPWNTPLNQTRQRPQGINPA